MLGCWLFTLCLSDRCFGIVLRVRTVEFIIPTGTRLCALLLGLLCIFVQASCRLTKPQSFLTFLRGALHVRCRNLQGPLHRESLLLLCCVCSFASQPHLLVLCMMLHVQHRKIRFDRWPFALRDGLLGSRLW
jgi:hypothetical protein